jgi:guanylate kinase
MKENILFVISGPSGVGKGTLLAEMVKNDDSLVYSVSATTRNMRQGEAEGVTYYYKSHEEFDRLIEAGDVIEWDEYEGNKYGTLISSINKSLETGKNIVLDITVPGAVNIKKTYGDRAVSVFILPPSIEVLRDRLLGRNREGLEEIESRISFAVNGEISQYKNFDYVIINSDLDTTVESLFDILHATAIKYRNSASHTQEEEAILQKAEQYRTEKCGPEIEEKLHISN